MAAEELPSPVRPKSSPTSTGTCAPSRVPGGDVAALVVVAEDIATRQPSRRSRHSSRASRVARHRRGRPGPAPRGCCGARSGSTRPAGAACSGQAGPCRRTLAERRRARARSTYARVIRAEVIRSRLPCPATRCRPARVRTGSEGSNHGASATTPTTLGWSATWIAVRAPIEWPSSTTGTPGCAAAAWSSAQRASGTGEGSGPASAFQPRTPKRSSHSDSPCVEDARLEGVAHGRRTTERGAPRPRPG